MILPNENGGAGPFPEARFAMGRIFATPAALKAISPQDMSKCLARHLSGDWGDLDMEDVRENEFSLKEGFRLFSAYHGENGIKFWIITEADRSITTILLPADY
jgi:hypothetical protein